ARRRTPGHPRRRRRVAPRRGDHLPSRLHAGHARGGEGGVHRAPPQRGGVHRLPGRPHPHPARGRRRHDRRGGRLHDARGGGADGPRRRGRHPAPPHDGALQDVRPPGAPRHRHVGAPHGRRPGRGPRHGGRRRLARGERGERPRQRLLRAARLRGGRSQAVPHRRPLGAGPGPRAAPL
ncbi:MAG: hypothetical protein AVDCRST_MAG36-240, partial [uncultured Nocardioidaceae bacterium]